MGSIDVGYADYESRSTQSFDNSIVRGLAKEWSSAAAVYYAINFLTKNINFDRYFNWLFRLVSRDTGTMYFPLCYPMVDVWRKLSRDPSSKRSLLSFQIVSVRDVLFGTLIRKWQWGRSSIGVSCPTCKTCSTLSPDSFESPGTSSNTRNFSGPGPLIPGLFIPSSASSKFFEWSMLIILSTLAISLDGDEFCISTLMPLVPVIWGRITEGFWRFPDILGNSCWNVLFRDNGNRPFVALTYSSVSYALISHNRNRTV